MQNPCIWIWNMIKVYLNHCILPIISFFSNNLHYKSFALSTLSMHIIHQRPLYVKTRNHKVIAIFILTLRWRHNRCDGVSKHQPHDCLLNRLFRCRSKKASELRVTGLCEGNSPVTGEFPAQMASNAENVSIWWRHHERIFHCNPTHRSKPYVSVSGININERFSFLRRPSPD